MLANRAHVTIAGTDFLLEEDVEGHYVQSLEPLTIPGLSIAGRPGKESVRRDIMFWDSDDWSGGEGEKFFDPQDPTTYYTSVDANTRNPGYLAVRVTATTVTIA